MISVGLTGGIGSGKSVVSEMFKILNVSIYNSDNQAKFLMETSSELKSEIIKLFGFDSYIENKINKQFIASKIFSNETLRNNLNELVHKFVFEDYIIWATTKVNSKFVIIESAILFEIGKANFNNFNILVISPVELKTKRLKDRGMTDVDIALRMATQWSDEQTTKISDYIIINDEQHFISRQVLSIYKDIISKINS